MADHWGYMPLSFFAVERSFLASADPAANHGEFRAMVDALHGAGIEVVIDVVYNHTCERGANGPTYSFKGIDNSTCYMMTGDAAAMYADYSGTGNTMSCRNQAVRKLVLDSMRHWQRLGVVGFRFDLASIFARDADGTIRFDDPPIFGEIAADPDFAGMRLIAEPWDAGAYQLGRGFPGSTWQQWNGCFRDDVRRFVRGDPGVAPSMMRRLYGSDDLFPDDPQHAYRSADGPPQSFSWNCGWEGDEGLPPDVAALRIRQAKAMLALLFLANGTPMLRGGDEFLHTQRGNDNPFNQDNATTWIDWTRRERYAEILRFTRLAIAFPRCIHRSAARDSGARTSDGIPIAPRGAEPASQEGCPGDWLRVTDTARSSPDDFRTPGEEPPIMGSSYTVGARAVVVLIRASRP